MLVSSFFVRDFKTDAFFEFVPPDDFRNRPFVGIEWLRGRQYSGLNLRDFRVFRVNRIHRYYRVYRDDRIHGHSYGSSIYHYSGRCCSG